MSTIRAAAVQFEHTPNDKEANFRVIERFAEQAARQHVRLLAFPECCIVGYWFLHKLSNNQIAALAEPVPGTSSKRLLALARRYGMTIGAGLIERRAGRLYNAYVVAMPDGQCRVHRKLHAFEHECVSSGDVYTVFDTPHGVRVGVLICYDNNIIENVRITALMGAQVVMAPHQTGGCKLADPNIMGLVKRKLWDERRANPAAIEAEFRGDKGRGWLMRWLPARAHDNGVFYLFSNGVGIDADEIRTGNAMILDPYGRILAETSRAADDMVVADLDLDLIPGSTGQRWIKTRRPLLYTPLTVPTGNEIDTRVSRMKIRGA